jgi:Fe-S-cluster containining protein
MDDWQAPIAGAGYSPTGTQDPCLTCGACCASFRVSFYWSEADAAAGGYVPPEMTCHVAPLICAMQGTDGPHPHCIALQGAVGSAVWCTVYERRPSVCREVTPSGQNGRTNSWCDRARAIWGLPPLLAGPAWGGPMPQTL